MQPGKFSKLRSDRAMVYTARKFTTIEEYAALTTSDLPECRFELVDGEIIEMTTENHVNIRIASFLVSVLLQFIPYYLLCRGTEIQVHSSSVTCREPDLVVLTAATHAAMQRDKRSIITLDMPPPALVVEVVSPGDAGSANYQRDYIDKPNEYAARGIPEYWRIDPGREVVAVLELNGKAYQVKEFRGSVVVISPTFKDLTLTAQDILTA
jgi:Uma2 family endonuclease